MKKLLLVAIGLFAFRLFAGDYTHVKCSDGPYLYVLQQDDSKKPTIEEKMEKYYGAYQIEVKNPRYKPSIPYNLDELIEKNRKSFEVSYVQLSDLVRLKIYPVSDIARNKADKDFKVITSY